jgi:hypothetical protein
VTRPLFPAPVDVRRSDRRPEGLVRSAGSNPLCTGPDVTPNPSTPGGVGPDDQEIACTMLTSEEVRFETTEAASARPMTTQRVIEDAVRTEIRTTIRGHRRTALQSFRLGKPSAQTRSNWSVMNRAGQLVFTSPVPRLMRRHVTMPYTPTTRPQLVLRPSSTGPERPKRPEDRLRR